MLWDVDYTLIRADGVGRRLYELAFAELYGRDLPPEAWTVLAGRTERAITLDVLAAAGIADPRGQVTGFHAAMGRHAPDLASLVRSRAFALPGARAALAALAAPQPGAIRQSVLTGNIRPTAEVKLQPLGLTEHLNLDIGAYGDAHEVRAELVPLARARAALRYGCDFGAATVLVGDTPLDVEAALASGARAVGVATGGFSTAQLAAAGAHAVLPDLTDTAAVITAIRGS